jgi:hypothetical protein
VQLCEPLLTVIAEVIPDALDVGVPEMLPLELRLSPGGKYELFAKVNVGADE